jgi:hypothetical protein
MPACCQGNQSLTMPVPAGRLVLFDQPLRDLFASAAGSVRSGTRASASLPGHTFLGWAGSATAVAVRPARPQTDPSRTRTDPDPSRSRRGRCRARFSKAQYSALRNPCVLQRHLDDFLAPLLATILPHQTEWARSESHSGQSLQD